MKQHDVNDGGMIADGQQASKTVRAWFYPSYKAMSFRTYPTDFTFPPHPVGNNQCRAVLLDPTLALVDH